MEGVFEEVESREGRSGQGDGTVILMELCFRWGELLSRTALLGNQGRTVMGFRSAVGEVGGETMSE